MAVTDEFAFDPTLWVDGVNTMDQDEFVLLLERELSVNALLADKINLFSAFDLQGRFDQYGLDVPDGVLSFLEFSEAAQKCICKPGTALGRIMLPLNGIKWEREYPRRRSGDPGAPQRHRILFRLHVFFRHSAVQFVP